MNEISERERKAKEGIGIAVGGSTGIHIAIIVDHNNLRWCS